MVSLIKGGTWAQGVPRNKSGLKIEEGTGRRRGLRNDELYYCSPPNAIIGRGR